MVSAWAVALRLASRRRRAPQRADWGTPYSAGLLFDFLVLEDQFKGEGKSVWLNGSANDCADLERRYSSDWISSNSVNGILNLD